MISIKLISTQQFKSEQVKINQNHKYKQTINKNQYRINTNIKTFIRNSMKSHSPANRNKYGSSERQSLTVKTENLNHFDSRWAEIKITGNICPLYAGKNIPNRSNHTAIIHGQFMYVHGGYDVDKGILGDFHKIDLNQENRDYDYSWIELNNYCDGKLIKLKNHTAVTYQQKIYIFGGEMSSAESSNLTYVYNINTNSWEKLKSNIQLPGVDSHCATLLQGKMYIYGGYIPSKAELMKDVYAMDLDKLTWEKVHTSHKDGKQPEGRSNCAMVGYEKNLYVFGGSNGVNTLNDFWKFSLTNKTWQIIQTQNTPSQRRGQSMLLFQNYIFMFGGIQDITKEKNDVYIYEFNNKNWKKIHTTTNSVYDCSPTLKRQKKEGKSPDKLALVRISPQKSSTQADAMKKILNQNKQKKFQERKKQLLKQFSQKPGEAARQRSFSPTTESMLKTLQAIGNQQSAKKETKQQIIYDQSNRMIIGKKPCARDGQTICVKGDCMFIFGGDRHLMAFNDLYSFDLAKGIKSLQLYSTNKSIPKEGQNSPTKSPTQNEPTLAI